MTSITFRPTYEEFNKYKDVFRENFVKKWKNKDYLISPESANGDVINHYQIYLDIDVRPDSIKRTLKNTILKGITLTNFNVAIRVKKVKTNYTGVIGYCMKEIDDLEVITSNISPNLLIQYRDEYRRLSNDKKMIVDKSRVNMRNIHITFKRYWEINKEKIRKEMTDITDDDCNTHSFSKIMIIGDKFNTDKTKFVLCRMLEDDYQCFNLFLRTQEFNRVVNVLMNYMNGTLFDSLVD